MKRGALATDPGQRAAVRSAAKRGGALANEPQGWKLGTTPEQLARQQANLQRRVANNPNNTRAAERLRMVQGAMNPANTPPTTPAQPINVNPEINQAANQSMLSQFGQIQQMQGANPMGIDYESMRRQAEDRAMAMFQRNNEADFARQRESFDQQMASQGIPVGSKAYSDAYETMIARPQMQARQGAMDQAFQAGQGEQAQMFNQQVNRAMLPYQQLGAFSPFYQAQMQSQLQGDQQSFLGGQNALDREQAIRLANLNAANQLKINRLSPRGDPNALSIADRLRLQDNEAMHRLVEVQATGGMNTDPLRPRDPFMQGVAQGGMLGSGMK